MSRHEQLVPVLMMAVATALLLLGVAMTGAGVGGVRAKAFTERWEQMGTESSDQAWEAAREAAAAAVANYPQPLGTEAACATHARLAHTYLYLLQLDAPLVSHIVLSRRQGQWQKASIASWPRLA